MKKIKVLCPMCGSSIELTEYGGYLSSELKDFKLTYEGWCPSCSERVVEHIAPAGLEDNKNDIG